MLSNVLVLVLVICVLAPTLHAQDMLLWNPSTFVDQDGTYFQVVGTNLPTQSVLVYQVPIMNQPAAAVSAPGQQASDPKFTMREFMDLMKFAQSQSVEAQRIPLTPVTGLTRQPAVPQMLGRRICHLQCWSGPQQWTTIQ